jgi:hypothetical protein
MTDCHDCAQAAAKRWHSFSAGCKGCCARAASRSPHYRRCRDSGVQDREYRGLLTQFSLSHREVQDAAQSDAMETQRQ